MKGRNNPRKTRKTKEAITRMTGNPGKAHFFYGMLADRAKEATEQYARWNDMLEVLARMKTNKLNPPANP